LKHATHVFTARSKPLRRRHLEELIRHIQDHDDVWFGTHADIARFVKNDD
jgi:hypothetical protein